MNRDDIWPALPYEEWAPTKKTMQMTAQMLGKLRLALAPPQPEWLHACLYPDGRGLTTGSMPSGTRLLSAGLDVYDGTLWLRTSDGGQLALRLEADRCVADLWGDFRSALADLGVGADLWERPQEVGDVPAFSENRHDCTFVAADAQRFVRVLAAIQGAFEEFRSGFFGRSGVQFWWGAFDLAVLLFSGKHAEAPDDRGYIMRYDLDAEHMNAGFFPGDDNAPAPGFYAYLHPRPDGCETAAVDPERAGWVEAVGEWMLAYDDVRTSEDPREAILSFLRSVYRVATTIGGWDALDHSYAPPAPAPRR